MEFDLTFGIAQAVPVLEGHRCWGGFRERLEHGKLFWSLTGSSLLGQPFGIPSAYENRGNGGQPLEISGSHPGFGPFSSELFVHEALVVEKRSGGVLHD